MEHALLGIPYLTKHTQLQTFKLAKNTKPEYQMGQIFCDYIMLVLGVQTTSSPSRQGPVVLNADTARHR